MNIELPLFKDRGFLFKPAIQSGNMVFSSGNTPTVDGTLKYKGKAGIDVTVDEAKDAAIICFVNCLSAVKAVIGDLDKIKRFVKITGFVNCAGDFTAQPDVMNAVSKLANDVFGEKGGHARSALGVYSLPGGATVEIEIVVEVE